MSDSENAVISRGSFGAAIPMDKAGQERPHASADASRPRLFVKEAVAHPECPECGDHRCAGLPFTTIIMPTLNEEAFVVAAIASLLPTPGEMACELIVVDGGSTDRTRHLVVNIMRADRRVRLMVNEKKIQAAAMNLGANAADPRAEVLLRADCHALYPPGFVANCVRALFAHKAASVVVPMRAEGRSWLQRAIACAQNHRLGNGGAAHRMVGSSGYVDHGHHAAFRRQIFEDLGGYDVTFACNEDAELDRRIQAEQHRIFLNADATITYFPRDNLAALARQYFKYGIGRSHTLMKHGAFPRPRQLLPIGCLLACLSGLGLMAFDWRAAALPLAYGSVCIGNGIVLAAEERSVAALASGIPAIVMHMSWAAGFIYGLAELRLARVVRERQIAKPSTTLGAQK